MAGFAAREAGAISGLWWHARCASAKYLAHAGVASRRASEELVFGGRVTVGGEVVRDPARDVDGSEGIEVDGRPAKAWKGERAVYARQQAGRRRLHGARPAGAPDGRRARPERPPAVPGRAAGRRHHRADPAHGRRAAGAPAHPSLVRGPARLPRDGAARRRSASEALRRLREGVELDDGVTAPARVRRLAPDTIEITIHEGRKRQVRRMCDAVGHPVAALERVAFGPLGLRGLAPGEHRRLTGAEIERLRHARAERAGRDGEKGGDENGRRPGRPAAAAGPAARARRRAR